MLNPVEIISLQNAVIKLQSDAIEELFTLLMQHISVEEADKLPVIAKINQAAEIRREID